MYKRSSVSIKRTVAMLSASILLIAGLMSAVAQKAEDPDSRLTAEHLKAYYNFEESGQMGEDASGNNNHLAVGWGYTPSQIDTEGENLKLGKGAKFSSQSVLFPAGSVYDQKDFLDNMDAYTLSMFFQNTSECVGGILFNNKYWGEDGIRISVSKWPDPAATGQAELYLTYNYIDPAGNPQTYHNCVKFIPDVSGGVDQSWHHIALAADKTSHTIRFYFDGTLVHENSNMQALLADSQKYPMAFGAMLDPQWPSVDSPYDGALDEIRIYDFAAAASEAAALSRNDLPSAEEGWEIGTEPLTDKYDLYTYTLPYWKGDTVYQESVLVLMEEDGSVPVKSLMYPATKILSVRSQDLKTVYTEGTDYILKDGKLSFPSGSSIPMMSRSEYYPDTFTEGSTFNKVSGGYICYSEQFQKRQISVTYRHDGEWKGNIPSYQGGYIPKTVEKLKNKEAVNIVFYGDSITEGYSASGFNRYEPYAETWTTMTAKVLRAKYEYKDISVVNSALAGTDTVWGQDDGNLTPRVIDKNPDLVVIAFGMNDGGRAPASYRANIQAMIEKIRAVHPDAEFLLVSSMLPNTEVDWLASGNQGVYQNELVSLQSQLSGIAVARVTDAFRSVAGNKDYYDVSGNNVNHPNDFIVRLYAQTVIAALYGNIDTSALSDCIEAAGILEQEMYTAESWSKLQAALTQARSLLHSSEQTAIDQGLAALKAAITDLVAIDRLTVENLLGYYNFEYANNLGWDLSSKGNHLALDFWGDAVTQFPSGEPLDGSCGRFMGASVAVPAFRSANQKDYLDIAENYTLSFFFKMSGDSKGGTLFSNKNWSDEGIKISAHTWEDPAAVGQVEIYLTYAYRDKNGRLNNVHQVVHFMPAADGGGIDTSWHHIALSVNKAQGIRFFFDGQPKNTAVPEQLSEYALDCEKYTMSFGAAFDDEYQNAQECFNGWMDEIRVYCFAASAQEAERLYKNTNLASPDPKQDDDKEDMQVTLKATTESGLTVQLTAPKAALPDGVTLEAKDLRSGEAYEAVKKILGKRMDSSVCFHISLLDENTTIAALEDYASILLEGVSDWNGYTLCFLNAQGRLEKLDCLIDGNRLNAYSKELGAFVLLKDSGGQENSGELNSSDTGDSAALGIALSVLFASLMILLLDKKRGLRTRTEKSEGVDIP